MENTKLYLKEVTLSGYKSINNVNISFKKGLNIIIGKNAAGKTNFLSFLNKSLCFNYDDLAKFSTKLFFENGKEIKIEADWDYDNNNLFNALKIKTNTGPKLFISNELINSNNNSIIDDLEKNNILINNTFICHGIPIPYYIVEIPVTFKINKLRLSDEIFNIIKNDTTPYFIKNVFIDISLKIINLEIVTLDNVKEVLKSVFEETENLSKVLNQYTPIEEFRFSENYNLFIDEDQDNYTITNLFLEFKIDNSWLPFSSLSDGTKRLFYIISEILENFDSSKSRMTNFGFLRNQDEISRIILIEEPELGIHPHQFHQLMNFLKIESENKQIIITTHSPEALDALNKDELDRIIIASIENSKEGTKLNHLNEQQIEKAKLYMDGDFLSDYWLYSDLEKR